MADDIRKIKDAIRLSEVIGAHVKLIHDGQEFKGLCPFHHETTPSFTVVDSKRYYHCFGCGAHGDIIDWCESALHMEKREAISYARALAGLGEYTGTAPVLKVEQETMTDEESSSEEWTPIHPVPDDAPEAFNGSKTVLLYNPKRQSEVVYHPTMTFPYRDTEGKLLGYVLRLEINGKKLTPQITYAQHKDGSKRWCVLHMATPRPLYNLDKIAANPTAPILLVEGEKCADAAERLLPNAVVTAWPGGSKGLNNVDWNILMGRNVVHWPDADDPAQQSSWGYMVRDQLRPGLQQIIGTGCNLIIIDPPEGKGDGWDVADAEKEGWDKKQTGAWLKEAINKARTRGVMPPIPDKNHKPAQQPQEQQHEPSDHDDRPPPPAPDYVYYGEPDYDAALKAPYTALGHYRGVFYYLPNRSKQVIELTAMQHRELNMMQLASLDYWESTFPSRGGQTKVDWKLAADACMQACYRRGFFDQKTKLRGRGAWIDAGRSVLHLGETVIVDGIKMAPHSVSSKFTYQADHSVEVGESPPLSVSEANELVKICKELSWENPRSALLLAGFCVIAPVCGILPWRPNIWVTGGSGSGKSTIVDHIIKPIIGPIGLIVTLPTTESGIRQELGSDARPVIFDEAESEDKASSIRMQHILDLCRASSSESGAKILKGTAGHDSKSFQIRSCFVFSSINTGIKHFADESRVTLLVLKNRKLNEQTDAEKAASEARFKALKERIVSTFTTSYCAGMLTRTIELLPTLRANIDTFASAASVVLGSRRAADQLAPMIAGAYMLHSGKRITQDEAIKWLRDNDMRESTAIGQTEDDENRLLQYLMGHRLRVQCLASMGERTVGELIEASYSGDPNLTSVVPETAEAELNRFGIRTDKEGGFWISTSSPEIKRMLADTHWHSNWARPLRALKEAYAEKNPIRFAPGQRSRAVYLPIHYVTMERD